MSLLSPTRRGADETLVGKRRYNIKLWKTFTDCFNCLPIAAIIDEKIFTMHGGLVSRSDGRVSPTDSVAEPRSAKYGANPTCDAAYRCSRYWSVSGGGQQSWGDGCQRDANIVLQASSATSCGRIRTKTSPAGAKTIGECHSHLVQTSCRGSCKNTIWI